MVLFCAAEQRKFHILDDRTIRAYFNLLSIKTAKITIISPAWAMVLLTAYEFTF